MNTSILTDDRARFIRTIVLLAATLAALTALASFAGVRPSEAQEAQTVTISPSDIGFGATEITASPQTRTVTITNNDPLNDLVIAGVNFSGVAPGTFTTSIDTSGLTVGAGQSATFDINFDPTTEGVKNATGNLVDTLGTTIPGTPQVTVTGTGVNQLPAATPECTIVGTNKGEVLTGTPQADVICANGGGDRVNGLGGNDVLKGGMGNDRMTDKAGKDKLLGQGGRDRLNARDHARGDVLKGGGGKDRAIKDKRDRTRGI
jgi:Ca2+-binding RTX toxin-like protein